MFIKVLIVIHQPSDVEANDNVVHINPSLIWRLMEVKDLSGAGMQFVESKLEDMDRNI